MLEPDLDNSTQITKQFREIIYDVKSEFTKTSTNLYETDITDLQELSVKRFVGPFCLSMTNKSFRDLFKIRRFRKFTLNGIK